MDDKLNEYEGREPEIRLYGKKKRPLKEHSQRVNAILSLMIVILVFICLIFFIRYYKNKKDVRFDARDRRCVILGFGGVGQVTAPILVEKIQFKEYLIIDKKEILKEELIDFGSEKVTTLKKYFDKTEIEKELLKILKPKDVILDLFTRHHSIGVIKAASKIEDCIYLNAGAENDYETNKLTVNEQWMPIKHFRDNEYHNTLPKSTIIMDAGANPGLVTHFAILGLKSMAEDIIIKDPTNLKLKTLLKNKEYANIAEELAVDTVHISEQDTVEPGDKKKFKDKVYNSWCLPTFLEEFNAPAEIQIGTKDQSYFTPQNGFDIIEGSSPAAAITNSSVYLLTAHPFYLFTGRVTPHPETIEIADVLSTKKHKVTVAFVYRPHPDARKEAESINEEKEHIIITERNAGPLKGFEIMGATLISSKEHIPVRWYGSIVSCEYARKIGCKSNPTTLQVGAGFYSHLLYALKHPKKGMFSPHDFNSEEILEIAKPFLGYIYDVNLPYKMKPNIESLISTKENMDLDKKILG